MEEKTKIKLKIKPKQQPIKRKPKIPSLEIDNLLLQELLQGKEEKPKEKIVKVDGVEVPKIKKDVKLPEIEEGEQKLVSLKYPLIPRSSKGHVFASVYIFWDGTSNEFVYQVKEPEVSDENKKILEKIKEFIQEKIDIDFTKLRKKEAIHYINKMFDDALEYFKVFERSETKEIFRYYIFRDFIGLERIEPILQDPNIEDISADGVNVPIYVYHKDPRFGSVRTNRMFKTRTELDSFIMKLSERCGKTISIANPLLNGTLPDGSRVQATFESDIARRGSNFTIRKFTEKPLTPVDLLKYGTIDLTVMAYLWLAVEYGSSVLISGGTASGKTSLLNVLSLFIKPQLKIISIEDTAELRLCHQHWIPQVARVPIAGEKKEIDLYQLLKESLRQRPDYIIVGEVRGMEAYVLFQQIALGHAALSTIHAETFPKLIDRLTTPPISLPSSLLGNLDLVIFVERIKRKGKYLRRVSNVTEVVGYDREAKLPLTNEVFVWDILCDEFSIKNKSYLLKKIMINTGMNERGVKNEINDRTKVLYWLAKRKIDDYRKVASIINLFYTTREYLMDRIEGGI